VVVALDRVTVRVPATVANLGAGFDVLAAAVGLYASVTLQPAPSPRVTVLGPSVPQDATNLTYRSAAAVAQAVGYTGAFLLQADSPIPLRSGLGSSAAAIVGGAVAASRLLGDSLDAGALLDLAIRLEGHPDNVAAALFGGVVIVTRDGTEWRCAQFAPALRVSVVLAIPDIQVETVVARQVLPSEISRDDAVHNIGRAARLVAALAAGRAEWLRGALGDRLHQPYRARFVPGFDRVVKAAERAGAYGAVLSGSGPTVAALAEPAAAEGVAAAMRDAFAAGGVSCRTLVTEITSQGALEHAA
jgi:homoserine kinase